jgi:ketosteroid isomerase-like protein
MGPLEMLVRDMFDVIINKGDVERIGDYVAPGWVSNTPQGPLDVPAFKQYVSDWRAGFPDIYCEVYDVIESGDRIAWRVRATGSQTGEFMGIPATGRHVDFDSMNFGRARDGKAIEHTVLMDGATMMAQLGMPIGPSGAAQIIETAYDAFARQDLGAVIACFDPKISWQIQPTIPMIGGHYTGTDAVLDFFGRLPGIYPDLHVNPERYVESGADVVVLGRFRGRTAAGTSFDVPFAHCWTVGNGKVTSLTEFTDSATFVNMLTGDIPNQEVRLDEATRTTTS